MPISRIATFFSAFFLSCAFFSTAATLAFETLVEPAPNSATQSSTRDQTESNFWLQNRNDFDIELNYDSYSVAEGLSQSIVTSIVEDEEGYVWIGTLNGLNRFDGTHFKHFFADDTNSGLPSSFIRSLLIDNDGQLLVGTDAGLVKYRPELETFEPLKNATDELASQPIWALEAVNNSTFIGLDSKLIIFKSNTKYEIDLPEAHEIKKIKFINGKLYIRNYDGDVYFIKESTPLKIFDNAHDIENLNGVLVISSNLGLFTHNEGDVTKISNSVLENLTSYKSTTLAVTKNDIHQLIGNSTSKKIGSLNDSEDKFKKVFIKNIKNNIYISLLNAGFIRITEAKNLNKTPLKVKGNIWSIAKTKNEIFLASDEKKISIYSHSFEFIKEIPFENTFGPKSIDILVDNLFIASKSGIYRYNLSSNESVAIYNNHTSHIEINNNALIAGTSDGEVIFFDNHNIITKKIKLDGKYPVYDILIDNDIVWIASQSGLIKHENNKNIIVFDKDLVTSIEKHNEKIVFGTRTSIYELKDISEIPILIQNNNKLVYSIKSDNNFLISTANGGINIISKDKKNIISLHQKHGAQLDYNVNSSLIDNKNIIFGGSTGLSVLNTESLNDYLLRAEKPKVVISDLSLFNTVEKIGNGVLNRSISHLDKLILKFSDYPFSFKFHVPGKAFEDLIFYYQMKGLSNDWLVAKEVNSATYTNLSHGEYKFNVYAIDKLTGKQGPTKSIKVIITPPWWLSFEAKLIYALLTLVFAGALFRTIMRRREVQRQIAQSEERLKLSLWGSGDEMWDWDIESGKIYRSNIWGTLEFPQDGQRSGDLDGESNIHPQDRDRVQEALAEHFQGETDHFEVAYRVKNRHGEWLWILDRAKIVERDNNERPLRMTGTIKDINNIKQTEEQLRLFARAIENISEGMFILDENHLFVEVNSACCSLLQRAKSTFTGELLSFNLYPESFSTQIRSIITQQGYWSGDVDALKGDGSTFLMSLTIDAIKDELGQFSHYVGIFSDITRRKQQEEELRKLTNNDILTGLANRSSLQVTLSNLVKKDIHHTLMVLDLDNFKRINDSLGHQIGDSLIINVAERIQTTIPSHASLYRLGGDEFAILLDKDPDIASSAAIALSIIEALKTPFIIESEQLVIGISIGIVLYPEDEQNEQALLRKADIAMYHAKSAGGNRYQFYAESLNQNVLRQLEVENFIRQGLKDDLFEVHYQAKVDLKLDRITGMEALVRLNHPQFGLIPPNDFIPLAEENGLIIEIGEIVLTKACSAAQSWRQQGLFNGRIAVNLSSKQFALPDLVQRIESILRLTGLPAAHLELEITEGTVIKNPESAIKVMQQLSKMGISLALDDFGTGYSSLSYLKRFPIHRLKVDKSFVDDIDKSDMDLKMVDSIITIAHNMGLTVVGEGVEQAAQLSILKALNCEEIQGYIFSKPIPESEFTRLLTNDINRNSHE
jgi:diguanylate cyclase (GGDEF)-like protein/PAS domain S-box-containing protein